MRWIFFILLLGLAGCAAGAAASGDASNPLEEGHRLYIAKCAKCHKLYNPASYSDQEWQSWMAKMGKKARLKPQQKKEVSRYVEAALRGAKTLPADKP